MYTSEKKSETCSHLTTYAISPFVALRLEKILSFHSVLLCAISAFSNFSSLKLYDIYTEYKIKLQDFMVFMAAHQLRPISTMVFLKCLVSLIQNLLNVLIG